ncbi:MAG: CidA/LrgA family protein [Rhodobacterales bacterium]|nr:CidA/LrgA family protein [Rhodobacterales bacterium]NCT12653.1 CidA/LrgA family protein [Rhodobacterales bacterium]
MIGHLTVLLVYQLTGEVISRGLGLPLPGPVIGMALLFLTLLALPRLAEAIMPTTRVLLAHLSLLFVPAGVGVVGHLDTLGTDGAAILTAVVGSTILAMLAAVGAFLLVARAVRSPDA